MALGEIKSPDLLHFGPDEARYALAYLRWRLGFRQTRPSMSYWRPGHDRARVVAIEREMDRYLEAARMGVDA